MLAPLGEVRFGGVGELRCGVGDRLAPVVGERAERVWMGEDVVAQRPHEPGVGGVKAAQPGDQAGGTHELACADPVAVAVAQACEELAGRQRGGEQSWREAPQQAAAGVGELAAHQPGDEDDGVRAP